MTLIWLTVLPGQFFHQFEIKCILLQMELVSMILLELNDSIGIDRAVN